MTEGLFLITTLFVAYVVYVIVNEKKTENAAKKPAVTVKQPEPMAVVAEKPKAPAQTAKAKVETAKASAPVAVKVAAVEQTAPPPKQAATKSAAAPKAAATKPAVKKKADTSAPASSQPAKASGLKDPISGEVVTSYSNYRFTKRWIKEALVAEGLVDKVYKNDELNAALEVKIKEAIAKLESNKKYQP
jgi:type IV secretory pathway VirB10-like protein